MKEWCWNGCNGFKLCVVGDFVYGKFFVVIGEGGGDFVDLLDCLKLCVVMGFV